MNYRKRRASAWAGLYVGLVGDRARTDGPTGSNHSGPETGTDSDTRGRHERSP